MCIYMYIYIHIHSFSFNSLLLLLLLLNNIYGTNIYLYIYIYSIASNLEYVSIVCNINISYDYMNVNCLRPITIDRALHEYYYYCY